MIIFNSDVSTLQVVIPLGDGVVDSIGPLFGCAPFPLSLNVCDRKAIGNSVPSCSNFKLYFFFIAPSSP